jgi:hypothetical protein
VRPAPVCTRRARDRGAVPRPHRAQPPIGYRYAGSPPTPRKPRQPLSRAPSKEFDTRPLVPAK